jgi:hypothetical protein
VAYLRGELKEPDEGQSNDINTNVVESEINSHALSAAKDVR